MVMLAHAFYLEVLSTVVRRIHGSYVYSYDTQFSCLLSALVRRSTGIGPSLGPTAGVLALYNIRHVHILHCIYANK